MNILVEENEISRLKNELNKSRRSLTVVGVLCAIVIIVLLFGWFASYTVLSTQLQITQNQLNLAERQAETSKFDFYYASLCKQRYGVEDLDEYLDRWQWTEGVYVKGVFDCSEMSAYIEWKLENEGYHTLIVVGQSPSNRNARHAWLLVETSSGKYMPIEVTRYELVKWDNPYFDLYFEYDHSFETISDALDYDYDGFDWWES